jgi:hypothetical protein
MTANYGVYSKIHVKNTAVIAVARGFLDIDLKKRT